MRADLWLKLIGVPELPRAEAKYTMLQQDCSKPMQIAKFMDKPIVNRIKNEASLIPDLEEILNSRELLCLGTQLLNNDKIKKFIKTIVQPLNAEELRRY